MLLKWDFAAVNAGSIRTALRSIESDVLRHNRVVQQSQERRGRAPAKPSPTGPGTPAAETKASEKSAREQQRAHERAEREKTRATEREARERARIEERWQSYNRKLREQNLRAQERKEQELALSTARKRQQYAATTRGVLGGAVGTMTAVGRRGVLMAGVSGGALFASAIHGRMKAMDSASGLANQMADAGATVGDINASKAAILKNAESVRGFSVEQALQAQRTFGGKAGDYAMGGRMLQQFADVSLATDVDINDVADVAANAFMKLKSENPDESQESLLKRVMEAVGIFAGQGNVGSVEMKDLASYAGRLTAAAAKFEGPRLLNMARMGALAQIAIGSGTASSAEEATTASGRFASDLTKHIVAQKKYNIAESDIYATRPDGTIDKTTHKAIPEILKTMMVKTGGELPAMTKLVGEETKKMMEGISLEYNTAEKRNAAIKDPSKRLKKGEAGSAAIDAMFAVFEKAALTNEDRAARATARLSDPSKQIEETFKELNIAVADKLMPTVIRLIPRLSGLIDPSVKAAEAFVKMVPYFEGAVKWLIENPWKGLGAAISLAISKELLGAGIGWAAKSAIEKAIALLIGGPTQGTGSTSSALGTAGKIGGGVVGAVKGVLGSSAMNVAPEAVVAGSGGIGAGGIALGALAGGALMGTIVGGSMVAVGLQQRKRESDQIAKGHMATMTLSDKLAGYEGETMSYAPAGLWGQAQAEAEARADIDKSKKRANETASSFGDVAAQGNVAAELKAQVSAMVTNAMAGPKTDELAAAMRDLTAVIQSNGIGQTNRGDGSSWLNKRP